MRIKILTLILSISTLIPMTSIAQRADKDRKVAYLAAYMKGTDEKHLYYAIATEGFKFRALNNGEPVLNANFDDKLIRDPMILKDKKGIYHLVATVSWKNHPFTIWDSKNLITWENERLVDAAPEGASKTWAPELGYDRENDQYFAYWTGELNNTWSTASIYYATTKDFVNFSKPALLFKDDAGILDADIIYAGGQYHLIYRKNGIWKVSSSNALGPYSGAKQITKENVEGPFVFPLNAGKQFGIVWDYFGKSAGYGLGISTDLENWEILTNPSFPYYNDKVEFPEGIRHGSIIPLTQTELDTILTAFDKKS